ncbi:MAG: thermonuclease family protein [Betaproteobacteria bacterium]|nr:thermonuclease family protein [Betaproteobacteria bacterium]
MSCRWWELAGILLGCCVVAPATLAATIHGQVVRVVDGDTITVADGRHRKIKVRLSGIDAPERKQPYGRLAGAHLSTLLLGKAVTVEWNQRDAYGRVIGRVLVAPSACPACGQSEDAGLVQITAGYAWWYRSESRDLSYADKARYAFAENAARARHRGLWATSTPAPVPPWQWRHSLVGNVPSTLARADAGTRQVRPIKVVTLYPHRNLRREILNP